MIDIHSHILPFVDDGSKDMEMSLKIAKLYVDNGYDKVIATPHYIEGVKYKSSDDIKIGLESLKKELARTGIPLEIYLGNEIYIQPSIIKEINDNRALTLNDSRYILIEFPMNEIPIYVEELIYELSLKGYVLIIAHPERYSRITEDPNILYRYIQMGALTQINLPSIGGFYGPKVKNTVEILLKHNMVHFVGTDTHSDRNRSPKVNDSLNILFDMVDEDYFEQLIVTNAEMVLQNKQIHIMQPMIVKKKAKLFGGFVSIFNKFI